MRLRIDDPTDPRLDDIRDLNRSDVIGRRLIIAEGPLVVGRLLDSRFPVRCIVGFGTKLDSLEAEGIAGAVPRYEVTRETLAEVAGFDMHRGLVAVGERASEIPLEQILDTAKTVVVLEGVGDPENIGSMFRNAAGMGVDAVLLGNGCGDPLYRRVIRVSMGHALRLPFAHLEGTYTTWQRSLQDLSDAGFHLVSLTPDPAAEHLADALEGKEKVALLVGAEGPGLTEHAMHATDVRARIPMAPGTDSLNLATCAAIAFYERDRATRTPGQSRSM